jgi:hypothetical protein
MSTKSGADACIAAANNEEAHNVILSGVDCCRIIAV